MDKYDIPYLHQDIWNNMPRQTPNTLQVKKKFGSMPKNLIDYSDKVNDKFLNNHLSEIEECSHKNILSKKILSWFGKNQTYRQNGTHDNWLSKLKNYVELDMKSSVLACGFIINPYRFSGVVYGSEVEVDGTTSNDNNSTANFLDCSICSGTLTDGATYNKMKLDIDDATGNLRVGVWDDSSTTPNNLLSESSSLSGTIGYATDYTITDFELSGTTAWLGHNQSSASFKWSYFSSGGSRAYDIVSFGAMPDPMVEDTVTGTTMSKMKISGSA